MSWSRNDVLQLALAHRTRLWGYLLGLTKDARAAEDLFQETWLIVCEKWEQFRPGTSFMAWACTIARFQFLASVDPQRRRHVLVESAVLEQALAEAPAGDDGLADRRAALRACLTTLRGRARQAVSLVYVEDHGHEGAAERLGLSLNALYTLLSRVRQNLRTCIERRLRQTEA